MTAILTLLLSLMTTNSPGSGDFITPFEKSKGKETTTYKECIAYYEHLAQHYSQMELTSFGMTDQGEPLHLLVINQDKVFNAEQVLKGNKPVLFINNGIHPGEPEGIDASMMMARDLMTHKKLKGLLDHVVIVMIPIYNVGGSLNRNSNSRVNQNGPLSYGFRGNAKNLDLNRDFVKCDSRNAQSFNQIFSSWKPHIFVDNHTSNGADYTYTLTLIATQRDKLHLSLAQFLDNKMLPFLYEDMKSKKHEMIPYVNPLERIPDSGIVAFLETPRYSTGYATLHNTIGFMPETHMLKPFADRAWSNYEFMLTVLKFIQKEHSEIIRVKKQADESVKNMEEFAIKWELDRSQTVPLLFKGYAAKYKPSEVSGKERLYYDQKEPWEKDIDYYNTYKPSVMVKKPYAYLIPAAWTEVVERLRWNGVEVNQLNMEQELEVEAYNIKDYKTLEKPYEGHYLHHSVSVSHMEMMYLFKAGDYLVKLDQAENRYIIETLEPEAHDSYFAWNFFDPILQRKEWYSSYVFEDRAAELLAKDPELKRKMDEKIASDPKFAESSSQQLHFVFQNSPHYEASYNLYPVFRLSEEVELK